MSWITGTQTEALSLGDVNGTAQSAFAANSLISPAQGAAWLQQNFFLPTYGVSKGLLVKAHGVMSTTSAGPTFTIAVYADGTQGTAGTALATTGAVVPSASTALTNVPWELEVIISCVTTGSSGTFIADGWWRLYPTASTTASFRLSSSAANPNTAITLSTVASTGYYVELWANCGTSNASNAIQVYAYTVLGLN